ncbi:uncharacterized protein LOC100372585 [Saccoglossus kowalevskii]|uniref:E3 ubiquitin-protein ligase n=1 Tax=Saccoglossus kowalevskii TaxID=10224 RepID=A0ABM0MKV4_SACKO|nr:PREDICTED: uncharacterized protein LOC100372585 [Saccoglossus kowalevskii]
MEDAVNKYAPNLRSLADKLERAVTSLKSCKEKQEQARKQLKRNQISVEQEVKQHVTNIIKRVKQEEQRLLAKVTEICGKRDKELQAQMEHIELDLGRAESMQSYAINFLHHGNSADILSQKQNLEVGLTELGHTSLITQYEIETDIKLTFQESVSPQTLSIGEVNCERTESSPQGKVECSSKVITPNMPHGTMNVGGHGSNFITINYNIPDGVQGSEHPNPGQPYRGMQLTGWLNNSDEGRELLRLLKIAFDHRLTFTIGKDNTVIENGITHKQYNPFWLTSGGWNEYYRKLRKQLAVKGIK